MELINKALVAMGEGLAHAVGFEPATAPLGTPGHQHMRYMLGDLAISRSELRFGTATKFGIDHAPAGINIPTAMWMGNLAGIAYGLGTGYAENGFTGLYNAGVVEVAANAGAMKYGYRRSTGAGGVMTINPDRAWVGRTFGAKAGIANSLLNAGRTTGTTLGGYVGASIGQSIAGTPGALVGGYAGAFLASPAGIGMGALGGAAGLALGASTIATVGGAYLGYKVAKFGAERQAGRRRIDTSGDMSAFMTQNAMTMRGRAVQAIHKSHLNARSALGMEANYLHSNRNYFSPYKAV